MNEVLAGRELFSDAPADDERWMRIVFEEAAPDPAFTIRGFDAAFMIEQLATSLAGTMPASRPRRRRPHISPRARTGPKPTLAIWRSFGL
jgi:hypothetical protein